MDKQAEENFRSNRSAKKTFQLGYNCAQSILSTFCADSPIALDTALKISTGFGAGLGRTQVLCGAVSGAAMVIGLNFGRGVEDEQEQQIVSFNKIQEMVNAFVAAHGTIECRALLDGCNLNTEEGQARFNSDNMIETCYGYVQWMDEYLKKLLA